eukprot:gene7734-9511_t
MPLPPSMTSPQSPIESELPSPTNSNNSTPPPPHRSHKRFSSVTGTSTDSSFGNSAPIHSNSMSTIPVPGHTKSNSIGSGNGGGAFDNQPKFGSPLKTKFLKVISSVKQNLSPQVDSLMSLSFGNNKHGLNGSGSNINNGNGGNGSFPNSNASTPLPTSDISSPDYTPASSLPSSLSSSPTTQPNSIMQETIKKENDDIDLSRVQFEYDFYSYYGDCSNDSVNKSNQEEEEQKQDTIQVEQEGDKVDKEEKQVLKDNIVLDLQELNLDENDNFNELVNNNMDTKNNLESDIQKEQTIDFIPLTPIKNESTITSSNENNFYNLPPTSPPSNSSTPLRLSSSEYLKNKMLSPTLNSPFKSNLLNQVSKQQSLSERSKFSLPILEKSPYPVLIPPPNFDDDDNNNNNSNPYNPELNPFYNQDEMIHQEESNNNIDNIDISTIQQSSLYPNNNSFKVIKEDIKLQRFKPLPPLPPSSMTGGNKNPQNYSKLSSILQLLSFSLPTNDQQVSYPTLSGSVDKYKEDLHQYINEYGDKMKIFQHINWHLEQTVVNTDIVKLLGAHYGFPDNNRALSWMLLTKYLPANSTTRSSVLQSKRLQYRDLVKKYFGGHQYKKFVFNNNNNNNQNNNEDNSNNNSTPPSSATNRLLNNVSEFWTSTTTPLSSSPRIDRAKYDELVQQVHVDVIRTRPDGFVGLFELKQIEKMIERILMIWSFENPNISYFQGLNDLVCPFLIVFLEQELQYCNQQQTFPSYPSLLLDDSSSFPPLPSNNSEENNNNNNNNNNSSRMEILEKFMGDGTVLADLIECGRANEALSRLEADIYWCLSNLLDQVKHYASNTGCGLPAEGMMKRLEALVRESNEELYKHLKRQDIDFSHFSFRWMVCFLTRDLNIQSGILLWDSYMCDNQGFSLLHICFCAQLLANWTNDLLTKDFMEMVQFLQKPPSLNWDSDQAQQQQNGIVKNNKNMFVAYFSTAGKPASSSQSNTVPISEIVVEDEPINVDSKELRDLVSQSKKQYDEIIKTLATDETPSTFPVKPSVKPSIVINTVSGKIAHALFQTASSMRSLNIVLKDVETVLEIIETDSDFAYLLESDATSDQKIMAVELLTQALSLSPLGSFFIYTMNYEKHHNILKQTLKDYIRLVRSLSTKMVLRVTVPNEYQGQEKAEFEKKIKSFFPDDAVIQFTYTVDPSVKKGYKISSPLLNVDATLSHAIEKALEEEKAVQAELFADLKNAFKTSTSIWDTPEFKEKYLTFDEKAYDEKLNQN